MSKVSAYSFGPRHIKPMWPTGGFDVETKTFKPFEGEPFVAEVLDALTAAAEAGILDTESWALTVFADFAVYEYFLEQFQGYEGVYRVSDQWWMAFSRLLQRPDEAAITTASEIAGVMDEQLEESGQLEKLRQVKKPKKVKVA